MESQKESARRGGGRARGLDTQQLCPGGRLPSQIDIKSGIQQKATGLHPLSLFTSTLNKELTQLFARRLRHIMLRPFMITRGKRMKKFRFQKRLAWMFLTRLTRIGHLLALMASMVLRLRTTLRLPEKRRVTLLNQHSPLKNRI